MTVKEERRRESSVAVMSISLVHASSSLRRKQQRELDTVRVISEAEATTSLRKRGAQETPLASILLLLLDNNASYLYCTKRRYTIKNGYD